MKNININEGRLKELVDETIAKFIKENNPAIPQTKTTAVTGPKGVAVSQETPTEKSLSAAPSESPSEKPKPKATIVKFDSETETPFTVKFSERGFSIDGTRLSFEALHNALSKEYTITLNNGEGLELTPVRMQKILKYEDTYQ